jgi:xylulokinase
MLWGPPYGDAFLAGVAVKIFKSAEEINKFIKIDVETRPNEENSEIYTKLYDIYKKLYPTLKDYMKRLAML